MRGEVGGSFCCRWKAHIRFPNTRTLQLFSYLKQLYSQIDRMKRDFHFDAKLIGQGHMTSQNCLHPIKQEELTFQMSQERKLCDQQCGYSTSG